MVGSDHYWRDDQGRPPQGKGREGVLGGGLGALSSSNAGENLWILASTVCYMFSTFKLCLILNHCCLNIVHLPNTEFTRRTYIFEVSSWPSVSIFWHFPSTLLRQCWYKCERNKRRSRFGSVSSVPETWALRRSWGPGRGPGARGPERHFAQAQNPNFVPQGQGRHFGPDRWRTGFVSNSGSLPNRAPQPTPRLSHYASLQTPPCWQVAPPVHTGYVALGLLDWPHRQFPSVVCPYPGKRHHKIVMGISTKGLCQIRF